MTTKAQYPDTKRSTKTAVFAEFPPRGPKFRGRCSEHGERLEELQYIEDKEIDRGGMTYRLADPQETRIAYCPECLGLTCWRHHDLVDASPRELVEKWIRENYHFARAVGREGFCDLFEPLTVSIDDGLAQCPFCAPGFNLVNRETGRCICPTHGGLTVHIRQHDT